MEYLRASSGLSLLAEKPISNTFPNSASPNRFEKIVGSASPVTNEGKSGTTHHPIVDLIIPQRDVILVRRVPITPTHPNDIGSVSYKVSQGRVRPGGEPKESRGM
jgi:hypothetical protein